MSSCSFVAGLNPHVVAQIKAREDKFGKSPKTDEELMVIHGNCPWVILRSGVDAPKHEPDRWETFPRTEPKVIEVTDDWAKQSVLGGELQDHTEYEPGVKRPHGIQTVSKGVGTEAYRIVEDQGHRPVPGITEVTVRSKDTWGMILEADIKIKCWSRDDLDLLDRVYFKPGYTALLEWGHTLYFREDGSICKTPSTMIEDKEFFGSPKCYTYLDSKVLKKRREDSNREAMFGYITNFSFSLNKDGSYDCSLKLLSKGSVIRGLRVKGVNQFAEPDTSDQEDELLYEDISIWHRIHQAFVSFTEHGSRKESIDSVGGGSIENPDPELFKTLPPRTGTGPGDDSYFNGLEALKKAKSEKDKCKLFDSGELAGLQSFPVISVPMKVRGIGKKGRQNREYYITLRSLLLLINHFNSEERFKFNLWDKSGYVDPQPSEKVPTVSLNPYVAIKPKQGIIEGGDFSIENGNNFWSLILEEGDWGEEGAEGNKIQNIWVNFDQFVLDIDHQLQGKVDDYSIFEALQTLLGRIQKAFGNVNEFQVVVDNKVGDFYFTVIDNKAIKIESADQIPEIQVTGLSNTVSNLTITSEISSDIANQMSIAAQAPRTYQDGSESSDEAMIHWGENCVNRWFVPFHGKKNDGTKTDEGKDNYEKNQEKWLKRLKKSYKSVRNKSIKSNADKKTQKQTAASDAVDAAAEDRFRDVQVDGEAYFHELVAKEVATVSGPNLQMGIIPIRVGLTMMGIGNLTIGNVFRIKSGVLLSKYQDWAQIITGIEHRITRAGWTTVLKTQYYPVDYGKNAKKPTPTKLSRSMEQKAAENIDLGKSTVYAPRNNEALERTCNMYDAMTKYSGYTWNKSQGHCARYTYGWARAYAMGKTGITEPDNSTWGGYSVPAAPAGGNACDEGYRTNLRSLGYREQSVQSNMTPAKITEYARNNCSEGDVLIYYPVNEKGKPTYYGHTQFNTGHGWVSDFPQASEWSNSGTKNNSSPSNYKMIHMKAPERNPDWCQV